MSLKLGARQRNLGGATLHVPSQFLAGKVGSPLSHKTVSHQFTSGYGYESLETVAAGMIKTHNASAYASAGRVIVGGDERTHTGIGSQYTGIGERRCDFCTLPHQHIHLFLCHIHIVNLVIRNAARSSADQRDCITRHKDVGVGRLAVSGGITTLLTRCPNISNAPFAGNMFTLTPASSAI